MSAQEQFQETSCSQHAPGLKMQSIFATFGIPKTLVTDNGTNFISTEFEEFLKSNGICHSRIAPYHPASNDLAERAV